MRDHHGIGKAVFLDLLMEFLDDSGYEILYKGRKVEFPLDMSLFFRKLFLYMVSTAAAARRVTFTHLFEMVFIPSKRKEDRSVLRFRPHASITKHYKIHPEQVNATDDLSYDTLQRRSYETFNSLVASQETSRDTIVVPPATTEDNNGNQQTSRQSQPLWQTPTR